MMVPDHHSILGTRLKRREFLSTTARVTSGLAGIYSITFVTDSWEKTIPSAVVGELIRGDVYYWGELMAGALLGSLPIAIIYIFFLDYYVSGLTAGATKG